MSARAVLVAPALMFVISGCAPFTDAVEGVESPAPVPTAFSPATPPEPPPEPAPNTAPSTGPGGCVLTGGVVVVTLDPIQHSDILDHVADAIDAGHPDVLTIARDGADERREDATDDYDTAPGKDRDEYPVAMSAEGGEGSSVRLIDSSENRSAGAVMGNQLEPYCDGQRFTIGAE